MTVIVVVVLMLIWMLVLIVAALIGARRDAAALARRVRGEHLRDCHSGGGAGVNSLLCLARCLACYARRHPESAGPFV